MDRDRKIWNRLDFYREEHRKRRPPSRNPDMRTQKLLRKFHTNGDAEILMQYVRALEREGGVEDNYDEIFNGMAKGFFVYSWASEIDSLGISPGGDYYHDSPPTPQSAIKFAKEYEAQLTKEIGISLDGFYAFVETILDPNYHKDMTPEQFGFLIASSATGSGRGLWEAVLPKFKDYAEIPYGEDYYVYVCETCGHPEPDDDHECL